MRMEPIFTRNGQLVAHVAMTGVLKHNDTIRIEHAPERAVVGSLGSDEDTTEYYQIRLREIKFRCGHHETKMSHLVIDEPLPKWVLDHRAVVQFDVNCWRS